MTRVQFIYRFTVIAFLLFLSCRSLSSAKTVSHRTPLVPSRILPIYLNISPPNNFLAKYPTMCFTRKHFPSVTAKLPHIFLLQLIISINIFYVRCTLRAKQSSLAACSTHWYGRKELKMSSIFLFLLTISTQLLPKTIMIINNHTTQTLLSGTVS